MLERPQHDEPAGRVPKRIVRRRAIGEHHLPHDRGEVLVIFPEARKPVAIVIAIAPARSALRPEIEDGDGEVPCHEIADGLEPALDEIAAPRSDDHRPLWIADVNMGAPQPTPVLGSELGDNEPVGNGIAGGCDEADAGAIGKGGCASSRTLGGGDAAPPHADQEINH